MLCKLCIHLHCFLKIKIITSFKCLVHNLEQEVIFQHHEVFIYLFCKHYFLAFYTFKKQKPSTHFSFQICAAFHCDAVCAILYDRLGVESVDSFRGSGISPATDDIL